MTLVESPNGARPLRIVFVAILTAVAAAISLAVTIAGGSGLYTIVSRDVPGELTSVVSASLEVLALISSTICIGALFSAAFLRPKVGKERLLLDHSGDLGVVRISALVWTVTAVLLVAVDAADSNGQPLSDLFHPGALSYLFSATYPPGAWMMAAICAFVIFCAAVFLEKWQTAVALLGIGLGGVLAPVLVGSVLVGVNHDFASDATIFALPALTVWCGVTIVRMLGLLWGHPFGGRGFRRYLLVSLGCLSVGIAGQFIVAVVQLAGHPIFASTTGILFTAQLLALVGSAAAVFLLWRQSGSTGGLATTRKIQVICVAVVLLIAVFLGVSAALARVPPPVYFVSTSATDLFFGYDINKAPSLVTMITQWRINILFFVPTVAAAALYVMGVRRLHRRGDAWPLGRTVAWLLGCLVVVLTTSSAVGPYASASFSIHMIFHMSLNMLGPLLLVLGGPVTLALRATKGKNARHPAGPHEWINAILHWSVSQKLFNPLFVFIEFIGSYYVIYFTPFFGWAMRYHWAHQIMNVHFLIVGFFFYSLVIGVDRVPRPLPYIGKLAMVLAAMPFHAFFGVIVMTSDTVIGAQFFHYIQIPWAGNLHADQVVAGGIAWAAGELPLIVVVIALVTQWARQDRREATQTDRHLDEGLDDSYDVYNEMLQKLASRDSTGPNVPST